MQDLIYVSRKEVKRAEVIGKLIEKRLTESDAATQLGLSTRQVRRLKASYITHGIQGLLSKKRGTPGNHRYPVAFKELALAIVKEHYGDFRPTFACEKLAENHDIHVSHETLRQWMIEAELWITRAQRLKRAYPPRYRRACYGELIQIDGSDHDWFEDRGPRCTLLVAVDDATSNIMALHFAPTESTFSYFDFTRIYLSTHGKPVAFYSDKHSIFTTNKKGELSGKGQTQFARALSELNIDILCANTCQAKGRVERANQILQDRLVKELRLKNISNIDDANCFVSTFIEKYNQRFGKLPRSPHNAHRPLRGEEDLSEIFTWQETRTLTENLTLQYDRVIYIVDDLMETRALKRKKVILKEYRDGSIKIFSSGKALPYRVFDRLGTIKSQDVVDNKRLGHVLAYIREKQKSNDFTRTQNAPSRRHSGHDGVTDRGQPNKKYSRQLR